MTVSRRQFLKSAVAGSTVVATACIATDADARGNMEMPEGALGLLFDSTLCVGCKACVTACKTANGKPLATPPELPYLDKTRTLSPDALNVIKIFKDGKATAKDRAEDGFAFMKHSCMHCVDPACVSACPVNAMKKQPDTGVVTYDKDACIGCRYCVFACPYDIPRFDYGSAAPEIHKCQLCDHLWKDGGFSACADVCPTGATLFGPVIKLKAEVARRKALKAGEATKFPRRHVEGQEFTKEQPMGEYIDHVYGEKEQGGAQMLMMSGVPFDKLGMPDLPEQSYASVSETIQHSLYQWLLGPAVALGGLMAVTYRTVRSEDENDED